MITELDPVEAAAVLYLRLWCDGPLAQECVWNDFARYLGAGPGRTALRSFEQLCSMFVEYGRRPLMRHQVSCKCLGADESCFANFVASAAAGDHEDAMWIATMIVRADMAPCLVTLAETVGLALQRMSLQPGHQDMRDLPKVFH